jgi:hypothetical protein
MYQRFNSLFVSRLKKVPRWRTSKLSLTHQHFIQRQPCADIAVPVATFLSVTTYSEMSHSAKKQPVSTTILPVTKKRTFATMSHEQLQYAHGAVKFTPSFENENEDAVEFSDLVVKVGNNI